MSEPILAEVFILVDSAGDYAAGVDESAARSAYEETIQPLADCDGFRLVKVKVKVPLPEVVELEGEAPATGEAKLASVV